MSRQLERPSIDKTLMDSAYLWADRGTCSRLQVGCVITKNGRILVSGYNGTPSGLPHCVHLISDSGGCTLAEHAERNAVAFAARHGIALDGSTLYTTHSPCLACSMSIVNSGIHEVVYDHEYRIMDGLDLLRDANVVTRRYMINP